MLPAILRASRVSVAGVGLCAAILVAGCNGKSATEPEKPTPRTGEPALQQPASAAPATTAAATAPDDGCPINGRPLRREQTGRLVAIGDVHGDVMATRRALRLAGAIDENDVWIGGTLQLVQTGDILDRGDGEQEILDLFDKLTPEAEAAGGAVIQLQGNHELMNAMGDFRYVTSGGFADFADGSDDGRANAFSPGGTYARNLAEHDMVAIVGDSIFVHGGVLSRFAAGLEKSNRDARCFLLGAHTRPPAAVLDPDGPLWTREFSSDTPNCEELGKTLSALGVKRMVVGHTPQLGGITSACSDRVWRIDTGMASHYQGPTEVLEIDKGEAKVLR